MCGMDKSYLQKRYSESASMNDISLELGCSVHKVNYWMDKYKIKRRSISDAVYVKHNPAGNPFKIKDVATIDEATLLGMGLGLFWGEGNKADRYAVRLGNTSPQLIKIFMKFLTELCGVDKDKLKFSLQIFSDIDPEDALQFWTNELEVRSSQFYKITVTISGSIGTYRTKTSHGVLQVYFHNKKLRDILVSMLPT